MRTLKVGIALMVVATLAIVGSVVTWILFMGPSSDGAQVFRMPGSTTVDLSEGTWGLYSQEIGGTQDVANVDNVTVEGPGEVAVESTYGFFSDETSVDVDGTTYTVFMRMEVPADGTYDVSVGSDYLEEPVPVVVAQYTTDDALAYTLIFVIAGSMLLGTAGLVTTVVGVILRVRGRRAAAQPSV